MDELLKNAIHSIEIGVEDSREMDDPRRVASAIRNIYAGVLLLCKKVLWDASPRGTDGVLIYRDIKLIPKDDTITATPRKIHGSTVNRREIEERFKDLGLKINFSNLNDLARIRNNAEHLFMTDTTEMAKEALASAMPIIEELLTDHLNRDPSEEFEEGVWKEILENSKVLEQQKGRCNETFCNIDWPFEILSKLVISVKCPKCESSLVEQGEPSNASFEMMTLHCTQCKNTIAKENVIEEAIRELYPQDIVLDSKSEDSPSVVFCPWCNHRSWVVKEHGCVICQNTVAICSQCKKDADPVNYTFDTIVCRECAQNMSINIDSTSTQS